MVTVICQHSGIEFEANSKRTKNHPLVSEAKITAYKNGDLRQFEIAMDAVRNAGGYTTAEEFVQSVQGIAQSLDKNIPVEFQIEEAKKMAQTQPVGQIELEDVESIPVDRVGHEATEGTYIAVKTSAGWEPALVGVNGTAVMANGKEIDVEKSRWTAIKQPGLSIDESVIYHGQVWIITAFEYEQTHRDPSIWRRTYTIERNAKTSKQYGYSLGRIKSK